MRLVAPTSLAVRARARLALPVNQLATDRVVAVPRRGRELAARLVQRECEEVSPDLRCPIDARLPRGHLRTLADAEGRKDLEARVARMNGQRHVGMRRQAVLDVADALREHVE